MRRIRDGNGGVILIRAHCIHIWNCQKEKNIIHTCEHAYSDMAIHKIEHTNTFSPVRWFISMYSYLSPAWRMGTLLHLSFLSRSSSFTDLWQMLWLGDGGGAVPGNGHSGTLLWLLHVSQGHTVCVVFILCLSLWGPVTWGTVPTIRRERRQNKKKCRRTQVIKFLNS